MALRFEELRVLHAAEAIADSLWKQLIHWEPFARETVGLQLTRAVDSIGANIAEAFGRFHFGEKLQFLYYARGSLYETKYWLNRTLARSLMPANQVQDHISHLSDIARQLNAFAASIKAQRYGNQIKTQTLSEAAPEYLTFQSVRVSEDLFSEEEIQWLQTLSKT